MSSLVVYLGTQRVGRLDQGAAGPLRFTYDQAWLDRPGAVPLSRSLPLQGEVFKGRKVRPFFAGILPEEEPRKQIARVLGISESNDFAMLAGIGGECAGAVSLLPEGTAPEELLAKSARRELTDPELEEIVLELPRRPLLAGKDGLRLSLAGAQDKLPVIAVGNNVYLPLGNSPSTHILKPEPDRFPGLAANEFFCMALARAVGLNVPDIEYRRIGTKPCVLVKRYDRITAEDGTTIRMHQEDFCQAMGLAPERKYQVEGGPTLSDCISLLRDWSSAPVLDIPSFISGQIFNFLIGNADAHGKNFSLLYFRGERRLAPFYDLICTLAWPELSKVIAMKIGGNDSINAFSAGDWKKMALQAGLGWPMIRERMVEICDAVRNSLDAVLVQTGQFNEDMARRLGGLIAGRCDRMLDAFSSKTVGKF